MPGGDAVYVFKTQWWNPQAESHKVFVLKYFVTQGKDDEISLYDTKANRMYLKRTPQPHITLDDLYVGAMVTIAARQNTVMAYGDASTRAYFESKRGRLCVEIPPLAYKDLGNILAKAHGSGFEVAKLKTQADRSGGISVIAELVGEGGSDGFQARVLDNNYSSGFRDLRVFEPSADSNALFKSGATTASFDNCTLCIVKPHAVKDGATGPVISALVDANFEVSAIETYTLSRAEAEDFLIVYQNVVPPKEFTGMVDELCAGPCVAMEVRQDDCVAKLRALCGPYDVEIAVTLRPTTLRARFGRDKIRNAVHCTDLPQDGVSECEFFFSILPGERVGR